ncbi:hypothetical protein QBC39DRAFT_417519 [Podospora conica]|nr:hypothetical protein QBC39DRAFT_417519 [Schizothecium conicum]
MPSHTTTTKRKSPTSPDDDQHHPSAGGGGNKKPRTTTAPRPTTTTSTSPYFAPYIPLLTRLGGAYDILPLSILSSTPINKAVARALAHLTRFSAWDPSLLPGVVFLSAKTACANKLVTVAEVVRRRVGESEQKWWQYNVLSEMVEEEEGEGDVVEETVLAAGAGDGEEYFEMMGEGQKTVHERATEPGRTRRTGYVGVLLSRMPVGEMVGEGVAVQTNEEGIEARRRRGVGGGR